MTPWFHVIHIFAFLHSWLIYGKRWTFLFFAIGFCLGLSSEHVGAAYGWIFGKFHYQPDRTMFFGTVPIFTPVSWWLILYCAYNTTNLILGDLRRLLGRGRRVIPGLFLLACLDGLMAMNLDMLFDPIMVCPERKRWVWEFGGSYFGIPIQNFAGWFFVGFCVSLLIRIYDVRKGTFVQLGDRFIHYLPSGLYACMLILFALLSYVDGYPQYSLIGVAAMMPFLLWVAVRAVSSLGTAQEKRG